MPIGPPEKAGNLPSYPTGGSFAQLLDWHLKFGTRPGGNPDRPGLRWNNEGFAGAVGVSERTVRNWRTGRNPPVDLASIERELFGNSVAFNQWRGHLRLAYDTLDIPNGDPMPRATPHFLGRDRDVATILRVLLGSPASFSILVQGGPGIGKTTLTQVIGNHPDVVQRFGEQNRWFVALDAVSGAAAMQNVIAEAIGADLKQGFATTLNLLRARPGLLVLDNLETPWDPKTERRATEDVLAALADVPGLALLVSVRGRDHVGGPAWTLVHPVAHLDPPYDAELFCRIAYDRFPNDPDLPRFMTALGGIPLAIELVAKHAYGQSSLVALWTQWERKGAELASHPDFKDTPDRLTSLPHSIELSLVSSRMTPTAWRLFRLLGQLPAGLDPRDRDQLLDEDGFDGQKALHRIGLAVERNGRLDLLPPIREHARRHYAPVAPDDHAWPTYYLTLTQERGETIGSKAGKGVVARLVPEFANIEAAVRAVLAVGDRGQAMNALSGLGRLAHMAALSSSALADLASACRQAGDVHGEANCIGNIGDIALSRSNYAAAGVAYKQALPLFQQVRDVTGEASCIRRLGEIALHRLDHAAAQAAFEQALPLYRRVGVVQGEATCIRRIGDLALNRSNHAAAQAAYEQALPLYRQVGDVQGEAGCIARLGEIALKRSEHVAARRAYEQALALFQQAGDVQGEATCIARLGDIALSRSDHTAAGVAYEQALPLYQQVGNVQGQASCIRRLGDVALSRSDHATAETSYEQALPLYHQVGDVQGEAICTSKLGEIALRRSNHAAARAAFEQALSVFQQVGDVQNEAHCIARLGEVALSRSEHAAATAAFEQALLLSRQVGDVQREANCIMRLGEIALSRSDHAAAEAAFEQALPLYQQIGDVQWEAICTARLGDIALSRSDYAIAGVAYEQAQLLFRQIGDVQNEAVCISRLNQLK